MSSAVFRRVSFVCAAVALATAAGLASASPAQQQQEDAGGAAGLGTVLWSVLDNCFDPDSTEPAAVCLKLKALTALDRALAKPNVAIVDGVSLAARAGKSLTEPHTEKADRAALDAAKDPEHKNALLDDMLVGRMDKLVSTRTIVLDGQEGRGKKKEQKAIQQAMMMAGMMAAAVMGPMAFKIVALMAGKALLISKIALVLSGIIALKKLLQPQQGGHETESVSHHYGRSLNLDAHDIAYAGQKQ
ncbi:Protein of unknown function DUF1676 [Cinara cedri]|uniref:Uncharacterized protein n=1 Tax=Cinara cedri TaxID=506608 RepID=A0A5E4N2X4_9HEMI|nr:Protein of unknown function DUF1676 [Cinara cedri]